MASAKPPLIVCPYQYAYCHPSSQMDGVGLKNPRKCFTDGCIHHIHRDKASVFSSVEVLSLPTERIQIDDSALFTLIFIVCWHLGCSFQEMLLRYLSLRSLASSCVEIPFLQHFQGTTFGVGFQLVDVLFVGSSSPNPCRSDRPHTIASHVKTHVPKYAKLETNLYQCIKQE